MSAAASMQDDLSARVSQAIEATLEPLKSTQEKIAEQKGELQRQLRDIEAQEARIERMIEAARLRKRAGRPAGKRREKVAAGA